MSRLPFSLRCLLFGHDDLVRRSPDRLYLQCADCGRETPGWPLLSGSDDRAPTAPDREPLPAPAAALMHPVRH